MKNVYITIGQLIQSLRIAYVAACKALSLANKLKASKSRIMAQMNRIRAELKRYEAQIAMAFDVVPYGGCIVSKIQLERRTVRVVSSEYYLNSYWGTCCED